MFIDNEVAVPFGNANYDVGVGGSHNMTFHCTPNTEIRSITDGTVITDISAPTWGKQVTVELLNPVNGHHYFGYQHFSAVRPDLHVGYVLHYNEVVGWSGGCTNIGQYDGTHNPTGQNFLDSAFMSSQPQIGIALCDGTGYGYKGWKTFPPIDQSLNPMPVVEAYRHAMIPPPPDFKRQQFDTEFRAIVPGADPHSGIANLAYEDYLNGKDHGPAHTPEMKMSNWNGDTVIVQFFGVGMYEWYGTRGEWFGFHS